MGAAYQISQEDLTISLNCCKSYHQKIEYYQADFSKIQNKDLQRIVAHYISLKVNQLQAKKQMQKYLQTFHLYQYILSDYAKLFNKQCNPLNPQQIGSTIKMEIQSLIQKNNSKKQQISRLQQELRKNTNYVKNAINQFRNEKILKVQYSQIAKQIVELRKQANDKIISLEKNQIMLNIQKNNLYAKLKSQITKNDFLQKSLSQKSKQMSDILQKNAFLTTQHTTKQNCLNSINSKIQKILHACQKIISTQSIAISNESEKKNNQNILLKSQSQILSKVIQKNIQYIREKLGLIQAQKMHSIKMNKILQEQKLKKQDQMANLRKQNQETVDYFIINNKKQCANIKSQYEKMITQMNNQININNRILKNNQLFFNQNKTQKMYLNQLQQKNLKQKQQIKTLNIKDKILFQKINEKQTQFQRLKPLIIISKTNYSFNKNNFFNEDQTYEKQLQLSKRKQQSQIYYDQKLANQIQIIKKEQQKQLSLMQTLRNNTIKLLQQYKRRVSSQKVHNNFIKLFPEVIENVIIHLYSFNIIISRFFLFQILAKIYFIIQYLINIEMFKTLPNLKFQQNRTQNFFNAIKFNTLYQLLKQSFFAIFCYRFIFSTNDIL